MCACGCNWRIPHISRSLPNRSVPSADGNRAAHNALRVGSPKRCTLPVIRTGGPNTGSERGVSKAMVAFLIGVALIMGFFMAVQPAINLELRRFVGSPAQAAMVSTFVSTISLGVFVFVIQRKPWPSLHAALSTPWWIWIGGLLGAAYV